MQSRLVKYIDTMIDRSILLSIGRVGRRWLAVLGSGTSRTRVVGAVPSDPLTLRREGERVRFRSWIH